MSQTFEKRILAYRSIIGRIFNFFLEPDIVPLSFALKHAAINNLLSESILLGSDKLKQLLNTYKLKVIEFHETLNNDEEKSKKLHQELCDLATDVHEQMRQDIGITKDAFLIPKLNQHEFSSQSELTGLNFHLKDYFLAQARILMAIIDANSLEGRAKEIQAAIMSTLNTAHAISSLISHEDYFNECVILSRGFFERILNISFLMVCDEKDFDEYRLHTKQKAYRKLNEQFSSDGISIIMKTVCHEKLNSDTELRNALKTFSTQSGKEKYWPKIKIPQRIDLIHKKAKLNPHLFLLYQLMFYTDASEAIHGSFYGMTFHLGKHIPSINNLDEALLNFRKTISLFLVICGELIYVLINILAQNNNISDWLSKAEINSKKAGKCLGEILARDKKEGLEN